MRCGWPGGYTLPVREHLSLLFSLLLGGIFFTPAKILMKAYILCVAICII